MPFSAKLSLSCSIMVVLRRRTQTWLRPSPLRRNLLPSTGSHGKFARATRHVHPPGTYLAVIFLKKRKRSCQDQKSFSGRTSKQIMAPLPQIRLKTLCANNGRFWGTFPRKKEKKKKRCLCLFTCLATRAVDLEMAFGLDTDSFLKAFYRMERTTNRDVI